MTENNTPHDKVTLLLLLHIEPVIFSRCVHLKLGHRFHALLKVCSDRDDIVRLIVFDDCPSNKYIENPENSQLQGWIAQLIKYHCGNTDVIIYFPFFHNDSSVMYQVSSLVVY